MTETLRQFVERVGKVPTLRELYEVESPTGVLCRQRYATREAFEDAMPAYARILDRLVIDARAATQAVDASPRVWRIVRKYQREDLRDRPGRKLMTKAEAMAHCQDPQTSSATCTTTALIALTRIMGPWFDAFEMHPKFRKAFKED